LGAGNLVPSTAPQQSTRGFVAPAAVPIKKTPDITDIIGESAEGRRQKAESETVESTLAVDQIEREKENKEGEMEKEGGRIETEEKFLLLSEEQVAASGTDSVPSPNSDCHLMTEEVKETPDFPTVWRTMFTQIFSSVPTIYIPLKETLPQIENNIIKISVKNEIQKEHFEAKARDVIAYLRTHFDEKIEDVIVETNEQLETKKIIYDVKDKLQNFKEQNAEFDDFIQILDLKIKD
jgi:hypothetical protein